MLTRKLPLLINAQGIQWSQQRIFAVASQIGILLVSVVILTNIVITLGERRLQEDWATQRYSELQAVGTLIADKVSFQQFRTQMFATSELLNSYLSLPTETNQAKLAETAAKQKQLAQIRERNSNMKAGALGDMVGVGAAVYGVKKLVDAYGEVSTAQGQIKSLGIDPEGIQAITKAAREFSSEWAGTTTTDFIKASYDIKSGISSLSAAAVGEFTKIAALTATGTKASVGTMTDLFATGYSIYREQFNQFGAEVIKDWDKLSAADRDMEFGKYFSAGISASVQQFKTDGDKISQFMGTLGASATAAKQSLAEQLAVGGMLSATFKGGQAATKYQQFLANAGKASEKLGIQVHDANGSLLSTGDILTKISDKYGGTLNDIDKQELTKAFGTKEAVDMIDMLLPKLGELKDKTVVMQGELKKGMATTLTMAEAIGKGPGESFQIMGQQLFNLSATVGSVLAPAMLSVAGVVGSFATGLDSLIQEFPIISGAIGFLIAGLIGLKVASIVGRLAFVFYSDTMITARRVMDFFTLANLRAKGAMIATKVAAISSAAATTAMTLATKGAAIATTLMSGAMRVFNLVLIANPIGLLIAAIVGLAAWGLSLVDDWSPVTAFFSNLWAGVKSTFSTAWELFKTLMSWSPIGLMIRAWEPLTEFFGNLWDGIKNLASDYIDWMIGAILDPIGTLKEVLSDIWSWFDGDDKTAEVVKTVRQINPLDDNAIPANGPAFAGAPGSPVMAGQRAGPVTLQTGFKKQGPANSYVDQSQTVLNVTAAPGMDTEALAREVDKKLAQRDRDNARRGRGRLND